VVAAVLDLHRLNPLKLVGYAIKAGADGREKNLKECVAAAEGKVRVFCGGDHGT
jgi:hypothetical protein